MGDEIERAYQDDGFVIVRAAIGDEERRALLDEAVAICRGERGHVFGLSSVDTRLSDDEVLARYLAIHQPHKISPLILDSLRHGALLEVLVRIVGPNLKSMQSMLFIKPAGKPGQAWHQDEAFIPTRDRSLCGAWIALDDTTVENGALWVIPGSHGPGVVYPLRPHADARFDLGEEAHGFPHDESEAVPVELAAGDVLLFNGYLLHRSLPNRAAPGTFRRSLVHHYMRAESLLPWNVEHTGRDDFRDIVMVAGDDPYAWKGTFEFHKPHLRVEDAEQRARLAAERAEAARAGMAASSG